MLKNTRFLFFMTAILTSELACLYIPAYRKAVQGTLLYFVWHMVFEQYQHR